MKKVIKKYILLTYGTFYCFLVLIGIIMFFLKYQTLGELLKVISSWTPTIILLIMFHKIYPNGNIKNHIKLQFSERIKIKSVLYVILLQFSIFLIGVSVMNYAGSMQKVQLTTSCSELLQIFGYNLILGPLGEELGWRGFLLNELQTKFSQLKSATIVGLVWGFWHLPLWFLSGYTGIQLIQYSICFMISIISVSIIITTFYNWNHNLVIPIIIHQLFNYFLAIQRGNTIYVFRVIAILYFIVALILILISYKKADLYKI